VCQLRQVGLRLDLARERGERHVHVRAGVAQQVRLLGRREQAVHAHPERAEPLRGQEQEGQVHVVRQADGDARALAHAESRERMRGPVGGRIELAVREAAAAPDQRLAARVACHHAIDHFGRALRAAAGQRELQRRRDESERGELRGHARSVASTMRRPGGSMHDLVIHGGTLIDGTGAPARTGDVASRTGASSRSVASRVRRAVRSTPAASR
jgi:hypothetical protein